MLTSNLFGPLRKVMNPAFPLHPLCTAWPPASDFDFQQMVQVTKELGGVFNDPATVWKGELLDGRNRQRVCVAVKCPFEYREFLGAYKEARAYVIAKNLARRHLQPSQRAMLVANLHELDVRNGYGEGRKSEVIAEAAKVSRSLADKALKIKREGDDEAVNRVLSGKSTLSQEVKTLKLQMGSTITPREQLLGQDAPEGIKIDESVEIFTDASNRPVPDNLADIWRDSAMFSKIRSGIDPFVSMLKKLISTNAGYALSDSYIQQMKDLLRDLDLKQPHHVCPHCNGSAACVCALCQKRWLSRGVEQSEQCYCCNGHGFLIKDEPLPDKQWIKGV